MMKLEILSALIFGCISSLTIIHGQDATRIIGGKPTGVNDYPFFAFPEGSMLCGATLIWNDILVSAAHCGEDTWRGGVWLGGNSLSTRSSTFYSVNASVLHPSYNKKTTVNDIMLIKINGNSSGPFAELNFNRLLPAHGQNMTAIGYGTTSEGGRISTKLLEVSFLPLVFKSAMQRTEVHSLMNSCFATGGSHREERIHVKVIRVSTFLDWNEIPGRNCFFWVRLCAARNPSCQRPS
jgi:Trypsin